jgi:hypothetical protein
MVEFVKRLCLILPVLLILMALAKAILPAGKRRELPPAAHSSKAQSPSALAVPLRSLWSADFLAAVLLAAASLLATTALFFALALLTATALFVTITLFVAIAIAFLAATALLAAFLSGSCRFDRFVRIALCFHSVFLCFSY